MPICPHNNCDAPISLGDLKRALETFRAEEDEELKNSKENPIDPHISEIRESVGVFNVSLTKSLESFVDQMDFLVKCPSCKLIFEKVPLSATDSRFKEVVKDDKGNKIEGEPLHHYLENRFRCRNCTTIFCCQCLTSPYHLGYTCRGYLDSLHKCKCRYCQEPVAEGCSFYLNTRPNIIYSYSLKRGLSSILWLNSPASAALSVPGVNVLAIKTLNSSLRRTGYISMLISSIICTS